MIKKVSFDMDGTMSQKYIQQYAKELIQKGIEVHIVTSRFKLISDYLPVIWPNGHDDLYKVANEVGIPLRK